MPDKRQHRGAHPDDPRLFATDQQPLLRTAVAELSWLLTRGYAEESALALVGNRYNLFERQRMAVRRCACPDQALARRWATRRTPAEYRGQTLAIDGYNLLITVESALSGGVVIIGRDGNYRDLASIHGTYRQVTETLPAVRLIADRLRTLGLTRAVCYLDRPVSNSGRLRGLMDEALAEHALDWRVELVDNPDPLLAQCAEPVISSDSWILDQCNSWVNLAEDLIENCVPNSWKMDLR